jgi:hypothetical protein
MELWGAGESQSLFWVPSRIRDAYFPVTRISSFIDIIIVIVIVILLNVQQLQIW